MIDGAIARLEPTACRLSLPAAACAVVHGEKHAVWTYGACTTTSPFYLASLSKAFTSTAACCAHFAGALDLDEPLHRDVEGLLDRDCRWAREATLRDALSMRLGLATKGAAHFGLSAALSTEQRIARSLHAAVDSPLRKSAGYHNIGPILGRWVLQRCTGSTVLQFLRDEVVPAGQLRGMTALGASGAVPPVPLTLSSGDGVREVDWVVGPNSEGAGGLFASIEDLAAWLRLQLGLESGKQPALLHRCLEQIQAPQALYGSVADRDWQTPWLAYGMGWQLGLVRGSRLAFHSGRVPGAGAMCVLLPDLRFGVCAVVSGTAAAAARLAGEVVDAALPGAWNVRALEERAARRPGVGPLEAWASEAATMQGRYRQAEAGSAVVEQLEGRWRVSFEDCPMYSGSLWASADHGIRIVADSAAMRYDTESAGEHRLQPSADGRTITHPWLGTFERDD